MSETYLVSGRPPIAGLQTDIVSGLALPQYDYVARVLTNSTTETYTFRKGGSSGTAVATVVVVYTDSTLGTLSSVTKT